MIKIGKHKKTTRVTEMVWAMTLYYPEAQGGRGVYDSQQGHATAAPGQTALDVYDEVLEYVKGREHPLLNGRQGPAIVLNWWLADGRPLNEGSL